MMDVALCLLSVLAVILSRNGCRGQPDLEEDIEPHEYSSDLCPYPYRGAQLPEGWTACKWLDGLGEPRGLEMGLVETNNDLLIIDRIGITMPKMEARILVAADDDASGAIDAEGELVELWRGDIPLNHGIAVFGGFLFATTDRTCYRWPYTPGQRTPLDDSERVVVVRNINKDGTGGAKRGHTTRTLLFGPDGELYISVGSYGNADPDSHRARVLLCRDVTLPSEELPRGGHDFQECEVYADGLRNAVGLAWDPMGVLWEADNGPDELCRPDLGGLIWEDNPAEEINKLDKPAAHYGYPMCFTEGKLPEGWGLGEGTQWAWTSFHQKYGGEYDDDYCRNPTKNVPPAFNMQAHTAPLGIEFFGARYSDTPCYNGTTTQPESRSAVPGGSNATNATVRPSFAERVKARTGDEALMPLPCSMFGDIFVPRHGSWNRQEAVGFDVLHISMKYGMPTGESQVILQHSPYMAMWKNQMRPVDALFDHKGRLLVSSDTSGEIIMIGINGIQQLTGRPMDVEGPLCQPEERPEQDKGDGAARRLR
ncbi:unnamed protein product [Vitrella brassicaformis CCMP3155]|uniref:Pyrroloquinoline quinone-dependent pyranose dehydrogenase beta-propeller domain-containing protein n=1 Tax=Vitrella brassicaformis (strain CCMP3155) TaxID=1169540 RepID=A0A0G4GVN6_VITBC|nr:unnamed protein product [Vitrella brassicaformis CCMP3155]|eukprot:CEM35014.1 unnamed protein product [Vitrella brassicaformis CCMP3155]